LPGSGHTRPDHPMLDEVAERLDDNALAEAFQAIREAARIERDPRETDPDRVTEVREAADESEAREREESTEGETADGATWLPWLVATIAVLLLAGGIRAGRRA
ncbi:MAG: hypothetical protein R6U87_09410, partial [Thiohalospira sp.]